MRQTTIVILLLLLSFTAEAQTAPTTTQATAPAPPVPVVNVTNVMPEASGPSWNTIGLTAFLAVFGAILAQIVGRLLIEAIYEHRRVQARIVCALTVYRSVHIFRAHYDKEGHEDSTKRIDDASHVIRTLEGDLIASVFNLPAYGLWACFSLVLTRQTANEVVKALDLWSAFNYDAKSHVHEVQHRQSLDAYRDLQRLLRVKERFIRSDEV